MVEIEFRDYGWGGEFKARGHAGSGEYGQDAVCAGVSALLVTLARRLEGAARSCGPGGRTSPSSGAGRRRRTWTSRSPGCAGSRRKIPNMQS